MIGIICAMSQERDAILKLMKDVRVRKGDPLLYHGEKLDNEYYIGKIEDKEIVLTRSGIGKVYATMICEKLIQRFKPDLVINLGCAGSLNENVHIGDVVVADKVADWELEVPGWERSFDSKEVSFRCSEKVTDIFKKLRTSLTIHLGGIVSADVFIYKKSQVKTIKRYFPQALCGEMEGSAIACVCYARGVECCVIRSISDETLVNGSYKDFDFNLDKACKNAAGLAVKIIKKY